MMNGSIAKRYAIALFEEAKAQFVDQQIYELLGMLHTTMKAEPDLQMALINPRVSAEKKYKLLLLLGSVSIILSICNLFYSLARSYIPQ